MCFLSKGTHFELDKDTTSAVLVWDVGTNCEFDEGMVLVVGTALSFELRLGFELDKESRIGS